MRVFSGDQSHGHTAPVHLTSATGAQHHHPTLQAETNGPPDHNASIDSPGRTVQRAVELRHTEPRTAGGTPRAQGFSPESLPRASLDHRPLSAMHRAQVTLRGSYL